MTNKKSIILSLIGEFLFFISCTNHQRWTLKGEIEGAPGEKVVLVEMLPNESLRVDSAVADDSGKFKIQATLPSTDRIYRLEVGNESFLFATDVATRTLEFKSRLGRLSSFLAWSHPSPSNLAIQELSELERSVGDSISWFEKSFRENRSTIEEYQTNAFRQIERYKNRGRYYIEKRPASIEAFFALFLQRNGSVYFDPYTLEDGRLYAIVATAFTNETPDSPYTPEVKRMLSIFKSYQKQLKKAKDLASTVEKEGEVKTFPPIELQSLSHGRVSMEDLAAKHQSVLLVFHSFSWEDSPRLVQRMTDLYPQWLAVGGEIFMISMDNDLQFWSESAHRLPWVNAIDPSLKHFSLYNINQIPSFFLIRGGELIKAKKSWHNIQRIEDLFA